MISAEAVTGATIMMMIAAVTSYPSRAAMNPQIAKPTPAMHTTIGADHACAIVMGLEGEPSVIRSAYRQTQCQATETTNGAVYLEGLVRNANAEELTRCWGDSLEAGLFRDVRSTNDGRRWLASLQSARGSIADEVLYWQRYSISRYSGQWQTYKTPGVIQTYSIQNAIGVQYPLTLRYSNSSLHPATQTSFKMQLPLASYLWHVTSNASLIVGPQFSSAESAFCLCQHQLSLSLIANETLISLWIKIWRLFRTRLGHLEATSCCA